MNALAMISLQWNDWLSLFLQYLLLSLLSVGGAIATAPEMHRYLVSDNGWLTDQQFNVSISIAQAAPGPNILFVALLGWNVGMNTGSMTAAFFGMLVTMLGILIPSSTLTYVAARWGHRNRDLHGVRAFKQGMAPLIIALLLGTGWIMASVHHDPRTDWSLWLVSAATAVIIWRTKLHLLWLLAAGALLGWFGLV